MREYVENTGHAGTNGNFIKTECFSPFVDQRGDAAPVGGFAEGTVAQGCVENNGRIKRFRQRFELRITGKGGADLREVFAGDGRGVQVNHMGADRQDFRDDQIGEPRGHGTFGRTGKGAVEVTAVGQIARLRNKAEHIHHRNQDECGLDPDQ